jgi:hypothetical protein
VYSVLTVAVSTGSEFITGAWFIITGGVDQSQPTSKNEISNKDTNTKILLLNIENNPP